MFPAMFIPRETCHFIQGNGAFLSVTCRYNFRERWSFSLALLATLSQTKMSWVSITISAMQTCVEPCPISLPNMIPSFFFNCQALHYFKRQRCQDGLQLINGLTPHVKVEVEAGEVEVKSPPWVYCSGSFAGVSRTSGQIVQFAHKISLTPIGGMPWNWLSTVMIPRAQPLWFEGPHVISSS